MSFLSSIRAWFAGPSSTVSPIVAPTPTTAPAIVSGSVLQAIAPIVDSDAWANAINIACNRFEIDTPKRVAAFLAQTMYESGSFTRLVEDLDYSAEALLATFPTHFTPAEASDYACQPERIANRVYANRMGNGPEASGDGWRYRGRCLIQITGFDNYRAMGVAIGMHVSDVGTYLETQEGAAMGAAWFWSVNGLNELADSDQFTVMTQRINGGVNGLIERQALWSKAKTALGIV